MTDDQRVFSPNKQYFFRLVSSEMRMSHWIASATLWEAAPECELLALGNMWWSTDQIVWREDSASAMAALRRYPGNVPGLRIDIAPATRSVVLHTPQGPIAVSFEALDQALEQYYQQHSAAS